MPHAQSMPPTGFQALILCGPGVSLNTFTASPDGFPKALIPIANRPMVWYPLEWCYRMGITDITLITPPSSAPALEAALSQNPHLTSLPSPRPDLLSPADLSQNTGTAALLRLPEVQAAVTGDFVVLPCDLVCELGGERLLEAWMVHEASLGGSSRRTTGGNGFKALVNSGSGAGRVGRDPEIASNGRRGGLGVWYNTKGGEGEVKGEETDLIATTPLPSPPVVPSPPKSLGPHLANLVYSVPTDTMKDIVEDNKVEKNHFPLRHALVRKHARVKLRSSHRDAHVYFFPYWVMDMVRRNEHMDSIGEDVVGWWAKAGWQTGLADKLGLREVIQGADDIEGEDGLAQSQTLEDDVDLGSMSSTWTSPARRESMHGQPPLSSRVATNGHTEEAADITKSALTIPPIVAYVHPPTEPQPLIRRVDTSALLLSVSLRLARLPSVEEVGSRDAASPFAHNAKVAYLGGLPKMCTVTRADCLLAENVEVEEKAVIKECVIGANCKVGKGARLTKCLLMDGAVVGEQCQLSGCILGRRCKVGRESVLKECEVQEGNIVPDETDAKNEKFMVFEGLDDDEALEEGLEGEDADGSVPGGEGDGETGLGF